MKTEMYCYLENRERRLLPSTPAFESWLDPEHSAIVCIDMHRGHVGPDAQLTCPAPRARAKIPAHNLFHALARGIGVPVIHVQHWQRYGGLEDARPKVLEGGANWRVLYELYLEPNDLMVEHSWEGTKWLDLMVEEDPADHHVRTKKRLSSFFPTDLEFLLRHLDVRNIVITGTYTDACDLATAFDAADRDFRVVVPRDVVAGYSERAEDSALQIISLHLGLVVDASALLAEWYARTGNELPRDVVGCTNLSEVAGPVPVA